MRPPVDPRLVPPDTACGVTAPVRSRWTTAWWLVAAAAWAAVFAVIITLVLTGHRGTISYRVYASAGRHWLRGEPLYETRTIEGFQYFPTAAAMMSVFAWLGQPLGGLVWRTLWWSAYALGVARLVQRLVPARTAAAFLIASVLSIEAGTGALGNGQANLAVAGLIAHAAAELIDRRWSRATVVLAVGVALKPLMVVPTLLAWALCRPLRWRLPAALVGAFAAPYLLQHRDYVTAQYAACFTKLRMAAQPHGLYEDLRGLLASAGWRMSHRIYMGLRALAAAAVLGLAFRARRMAPAPAWTVIAALAATYLMLFNPRTQSTSYAIATAPVAVLAAAHLVARRWRAAAPLVATLAAWMPNYHAVPVIEYWLKPFGALVVLAALIVTLWRPPAAWRYEARPRAAAPVVEVGALPSP